MFFWCRTPPLIFKNEIIVADVIFDKSADTTNQPFRTDSVHRINFHVFVRGQFIDDGVMKVEVVAFLARFEPNE